MIQELLKPLNEEQVLKVLNCLPTNSLYSKFIQELRRNPKLSNKQYAEHIGLEHNMNEFYQIKHQAKEMIEQELYKHILLDYTANNKALKYSLLSKFYFGKANHSLGKTYLKKVLDKDTNEKQQGFQLDVMNSLFLDLTERFSEENFGLIEKYSAVNDRFHKQTNNFIQLAKKLHALIEPNKSKDALAAKNLTEDLTEINSMLDKLPMDVAVFKLEYRFAEIYLSQNQQVGDQFIDFYIQLYYKWNDEGYFGENNHDLKLKSMVNISFLLLSNRKFELSKIFIDELNVEISKYGKAFKNTHEIYYVSFLSYYHFCKKDFKKSMQLLLKFEKKIKKKALQIQTLYFFYQSFARVLYYNDEIEKCIDVIAEIKKIDYKSFISSSRKINWTIFEFLCHYQLKNFTYCKNVLQKLRTSIRKSGKKNLKPKDLEYFGVIVKIFNSALRNVGYLENLELQSLQQLMSKEKKNPLFYDKIIDLEDSLNALKLKKSLATF